MDILIDKNNNNYIKATNPFEKIHNVNNDILAFYLKYNQLKNIYRQGWLKVRMDLEFKEKCESIADHSFSVALLALTIIEKNSLPLDVLKCLKMAIIHELGEVYAGDITPYDHISKEDKHAMERDAIKKLLGSIDQDNDFLEIWEEFEKAETEEAKFIKNIDKLEFLLQACAYGHDVKYYERSLNEITDKYCKEIALSAVEASKGNIKPNVIG